jgi:DNA-binding Xre family transcriptional regulator
MKTIKFNLANLAKKWEIENNENLSISFLSKSTGIRWNTLNDYAKNKFKDVSIKNLIALLQFFQCDLCDLIKYEEE